MKPPAHPQVTFASLDFPGRTTLYVHEVARRLGIAEKHVLNLCDDGSLAMLNIASKGVKRRALRIPIESYRSFICERVSVPMEGKGK